MFYNLLNYRYLLPLRKSLNSFFSSFLFLPQGEVSLSAPKFYSIHSGSACPQSFPTIRDAGFEPGTTASVVCSATNEPLHLRTLNGRLLAYEELDEVEVAAGGGRMQRGPLLTVRGIHIRTKLHQHLASLIIIIMFLFFFYFIYKMYFSLGNFMRNFKKCYRNW